MKKFNLIACAMAGSPLLKRLFIAGVFFIVSTNLTFSQVLFNLFGGISPAGNPKNAAVLINSHWPKEEFVFSVSKVMPQYFAGAKVHQMLNDDFFLESGIIYSQSNKMYTMKYTLFDGTHEMKESENMLQLPVNIGAKLGIIEVTSGLMGVYSISVNSELKQIPNAVCEQDKIHFGWSTGIRINVMKSRMGLEYQGSLTRMCEGVYVKDESLELRNIPGQFVFNIQYGIN